MKIKNILFLPLFFTYLGLYSQTISGRIYSKDNKAISGVTIGVEGENLGSISQQNGSFSLGLNNIDENKNLIASFPGFNLYKTKVKDFLNSPSKNILLEEKITTIKEVVISSGKIIEKNLGVSSKSDKNYCGYNSDKNKELSNEYAIKIKK